MEKANTTIINNMDSFYHIYTYYFWKFNAISS